MRAAIPALAKRRPRRRKEEDDIQKSIVDFLERVLPKALTYAIPNAARRFAGGRAGNAVPGLKKGMPDLHTALDDGTGFYWEVKTRDGVLSAEQVDRQAELRARGHRVATVTGIDDVRRALQRHNIITREAA